MENEEKTDLRTLLFPSGELKGDQSWILRTFGHKYRSMLVPVIQFTINFLFALQCKCYARALAIFSLR